MSNPLLFLFPIVSSAIEGLSKVFSFSRHLYFICSSLARKLLLTPHSQIHKEKLLTVMLACLALKCSKLLQTRIKSARAPY